MPEGVVKRFYNCYGFIDAGDGVDVFAHFSQIQALGYRTLSEGQRVSFDVVETPKGRQAINIVPLVD